MNKEPLPRFHLVDCMDQHHLGRRLRPEEVFRAECNAADDSDDPNYDEYLCKLESRDLPALLMREDIAKEREGVYDE